MRTELSPVIETEAAAPAAARRGAVHRFLRRLARDRLGLLGVSLVVLVVLAAIFADVLTPYSPIKMTPRDRFMSPSFEHLLGTDQLGRDLFTRVLYGGRIALTVALTATALSLVIGVILGLIAGYGPRWLDNLLLLVFDTLKSFPTVMLALALVTLVGPSLQAVILVVVIVSAPGYGRIIRTQTISMRNSEFILASKSLGAGPIRLVFVHILPNVIGPILILASMEIPVVITIEAGMSFLGLGVRPPTPSWGAILNDGFGYVRESPWPAIAGGLPIIVATLGFTFLGETLRDIFDPRLRKDA
ncbi:peptide/nickel transport system permease protein [Rhodoligotrophos appendicifer]|uniref:ABC transporter permease n=1 Tax=Rhodoligotrophos appendicifer TaxID=987056 RepID=UPI00118573CB|nr:ABC transporter permease [Rhodoligotrophos appendicifer]